MENHHTIPSDIYIPQEQAPEEILIYTHSREVVYKCESSNKLAVTATIRHFLGASDVKILIEDEDSCVHAINLYIAGTNHEHYSEYLVQDYLDGPELQSICANFEKLCIPKNAVEEHDLEIISLKENSIYE